jgi:hypothetical protein
MNIRWRELNARHAYFEIQDTDGDWHAVGRTDDIGLLAARWGFNCDIYIPRLEFVGCRVALVAARRLVERRATRRLLETLPVWFERVIHPRPKVEPKFLKSSGVFCDGGGFGD